MHHRDLKLRPLLRLSIDDAIGASCTCSRQVMAHFIKPATERFTSASKGNSTARARSGQGYCFRASHFAYLIIA